MSFVKIKKNTSSILKFISIFLNVIATKLYTSPKKKVLAKWRSDCGDKTMRLMYDLGVDSVVMDIGGYEGQWASDIYAMYRCKVHVFEPVQEYYNTIKNRFAKNPDIIVNCFGLSEKTQTLPI